MEETSKVFSDDVLSLLIFGAPKEGKSTLTSTVPLPAMVMDAEGSWKFIDQAGFKSGVPLRKVSWDPLAGQALPQFDGTWDICYVKVTSWQAMTMCYRYLTETPHQFVSLVLDSITEVQRRCKKNIGAPQMQIQHWGQLLDQMDDLIRKYRDLTLAENTIRCVALIAEMTMKDGKWQAYMQGQIRDTLPYLVDICGHIRTNYVTDEKTGALTGKQKHLLIAPHPQYVTGERVAGRLPDIIIDPNISAMMAQVYPSIKEIQRG